MAKIVINSNPEYSTSHIVVLFDDNYEVTYEDVSTGQYLKQSGKDYTTGHVLVSNDNLLTIIKGN